MTAIQKILAVMILIMLSIIAAQGQADCPPQYTACLNQQEANRAAQNARLVPALEAENAELKKSVEQERQNTKQAQETGERNVADLKEQNTKLLTETANLSGKLTATEANVVRLTAIIDFMLKNGRNKCGPLTLICVQ